jgi:NhaP-type Na+/H+ or K+/H+ antiporter
METSVIIVFVGLLVFLAHLFVALFEKTRVPDVLYLIVIGLFIGPVLQLARPDQFGILGPVFTTIALVVILFEGGLDLGIESLRFSWRNSVWMTVFSYFITLIILTAALLLTAPFQFGSSLFIAAVLAGPAPSVIIPLVRQLTLRDQTRTTLTLESSLGEAICIVVSLAILQSIQLAEVHVGHVIGKLVASFTFAMVIGSFGGYVWSLLLHRVRQLRNAIFTTPAFAFILFGTADFLGFSGPITALAFGITLGNANLIHLPKKFVKTTLKPLVHNETEILFFGEIVFLLKTFFFVYLGLTIQFTDFWALQMGLLLTFLLLIARYIAVRIAADPEQTPLRDAFIMAVSVPKGTAAAVLAYLPIQLGLSDAPEIKNVINSVVVLTIVLTALLVPMVPRKARWPFRGYKTEEEKKV